MKNKTTLWKLCIILAAIIIISIIISIFYVNFKNKIFIIVIIPVVITVLLFGLWPGIVMETTLLFLGLFFESYLSSAPVLELLESHILGNIIGILSHYGLIILLGFIHGQHKKIKRLNEEIIRLSKIDELTRLYNRRALLEAAHREFLQAIRNLSDISSFIDPHNPDDSLPYSHQNNINFKKKRNISDYLGIFTCAIFDIDFFKKVNDTYGHLMGDEVLQKIGNILREKSTLRKIDIYGRYGGEEFLILFPNTSNRNSIFVIRRIMEKIKSTKFITNHGVSFSITISTGISQLNRKDKDINDIICRADKALYYAKQNGRDQFIIFEEQFKD